MKLKNSNCDKTKKLKCDNSKTQLVMKLQHSNLGKTKKKKKLEQ